jgi:hypothetical protein
VLPNTNADFTGAQFSSTLLPERVLERIVVHDLSSVAPEKYQRGKRNSELQPRLGAGWFL